MKTVKEVLLLLAMIALVAACQDPSKDIRDKGIGDRKSILQKTNFHLEAKVIGKSIVQQENLKLDVPAASSCNIGESVIVTIFAIKERKAHGGDCTLPYGQIDFINPSSGCYMTGKFSGKLSNDTDKCFIEATIDIYHGVGIFQADGGTLTLSIEGATIADQQMKYTIEIDGLLEKQDS